MYGLAADSLLLLLFDVRVVLTLVTRLAGKAFSAIWIFVIDHQLVVDQEANLDRKFHETIGSAR